MADSLSSTPHENAVRLVCVACGQCGSLSDFMPRNPRTPARRISSHCRACRSAASKAYREQHREKILEQQRVWNAHNSERLKPYRANYYRVNKEEICARERERYAREYAAEPEKYRAKFHERRARIHSNGGSYTTEEWRELCKRYGNICLRCFAKTRLTVDHIVPVSQGGTSDIENLQPLCRYCNTVKGDKTLNYRPHHEYLNGYTENLTP